MFNDIEEREKYFKDWELFFENHHDLELENKVNNSEISIYINDESLSQRNNLDFEHSYTAETLDSWYSCRSSLRYLLENGFSWFNLKKESRYYQLFNDFDSSIRRSPYNKFQNRNDYFILKSPENKLYCILGISFLSNNVNQTFFGYLGELYKKTNKQTTIFDFIDEDKE